MLRTVTAALTCGVATLALSGVAAAGGELSKSEYRSEVNDICTSFNADRDAAFEEHFAGLDEEDVPSDEQVDAVLADVLPLFRDALDEIEALEGPKATEKKVNKAVDAYRDTLDAIEEDPDVVFGEDAEDPFVDADKLAKKAGIEDCVQGG